MLYSTTPYSLIEQSGQGLAGLAQLDLDCFLIDNSLISDEGGFLAW